MKKFVIALIATILLLPSIATAQSKTICNFRMGQMKLNHASNGYNIELNTNHSWDDDYIKIYLGEKEDAIKLLDAMIEFNAYDLRWSFADHYGEMFGFKKTKVNISITKSGYYGNAYTTNNELKRVRKMIVKQK